MARCGCAGSCGCAALPGTGITITGTGTSADPWKINATGPADCNASLDCLNGHLGGGLSYDTAAHRLALRYSTQAGNTAGPGSDGGLYVPPAGAAGTAAIIPQDTPTIHLYGDGTASNKLRADLVGGGRAYVKDSVPADMDFSGSGTSTDAITAFRKGLRYYAYGGGPQGCTCAFKKYNFDSGSGTTGVAHLSGGSLVVDIAGVYIITIRARFYVHNAEAETATAYVKIMPLSPAVWGSAAGCGSNSTWVLASCVRSLAKGAALYADVEVCGGGVKPTVEEVEIEIGYLGR